MDIFPQKILQLLALYWLTTLSEDDFQMSLHYILSVVECSEHYLLICVREVGNNLKDEIWSFEKDMKKMSTRKYFIGCSIVYLPFLYAFLLTS